jgi:hypothetical protein
MPPIKSLAPLIEAVTRPAEALLDFMQEALKPRV